MKDEGSPAERRSSSSSSPLTASYPSQESIGMESPDKNELVVPANTAQLLEELEQLTKRIHVSNEHDLDRGKLGSVVNDK